jgi:hypothetical protein
VVPAAAVSAASVRNAHYLLPAMAPWAVWAALRWGVRVRSPWAEAVVVALALAIGVGHAAAGPRFDRRGAEWGWYERVGREVLAEGERVVLLYSDWDKAPYPTPFGEVPADLAVRLFYLDRPAGTVSWHRGPETLRAPAGSAGASFAVIGRERDRGAIARRLERPVALVDRGPGGRWDRAFVVYRVGVGNVAEVEVEPGSSRE